MGRLKTLVVEKYKELPGTSATILFIRAKDLTNRPRTVAEMNAAVTTYAPKIGDKVRLGEAFTYRTLTPANTTATPPVLEVKAKSANKDSILVKQVEMPTKKLPLNKSKKKTKPKL